MSKRRRSPDQTKVGVDLREQLNAKRGWEGDLWIKLNCRRVVTTSKVAPTSSAVAQFGMSQGRQSLDTKHHSLETSREWTHQRSLRHRCSHYTIGSQIWGPMSATSSKWWLFETTWMTWCAACSHQVRRPRIEVVWQTAHGVDRELSSIDRVIRSLVRDQHKGTERVRFSFYAQKEQEWDNQKL